MANSIMHAFDLKNKSYEELKLISTKIDKESAVITIRSQADYQESFEQLRLLAIEMMALRNVHFSKAKDNDSYLNTARSLFTVIEKKSLEILDAIFNYSHENRFYWKLCSFSTYMETYAERLLANRDNHIDYDESDFLYDEIEICDSANSFESSLLENDYSLEFDEETTLYIRQSVGSNIYKKISRAIEKREEFLKSKRVKTNPSTTQSKNNSIKFHGSQAEFVELVKALIINGNFTGKTHKEIFEILTDFFLVEITNVDDTFKSIKGRNTDSRTLFLDKLKSSLIEYIP